MVVSSVAAEIDVIAGLYEFREADEVRVFLKKHPELFDLLERTRPEIDRIFESYVHGVFLELTYDLEECREQLYIKIRVDLSVEAADERLNRFDRQWWFQACYPFFGDIQAMVEWIPRVQA